MDIANQLKDTKTQNKLFTALSNRKPVANFENIIDYSPYRNEWFEYKKKYIDEYVKELLLIEIEK